MMTCGTCGITVNLDDISNCLACRSAWLVPGKVTGEGFRQNFSEKLAPDQLPRVAKIRADAFCRATNLNSLDDWEIVSCVQDTVKAEAKFAIENWMPSLKRRHILNSLIFLAGLALFLLGGERAGHTNSTLPSYESGAEAQAGLFIILWLSVSTYWIIRVARTFSISAANLEASRLAAIEFTGAFHKQVNKAAKLDLYFENPPR
jgi:hypothetical protein